ncbi:MAG: response regulator transcription factor [Armatimonadota bacterium]
MPDKAPENQSISVLIADDHAILREGLKGLLDEYEDISVVGEAVTGMDAIRKTRELGPDVLLLDLIMPELGGLQALEVIRKEAPATNTIILTGADDDDMLAHSIRLGARGYLLKDTASSQLVEAIRAVASGSCWLPPGLTERLFHGIAKRPEEDESTKLALLTAREMEVFQLLGEALSNSAIAEKLFISEHTVKVHVSRILEKLSLETRAEAIRFAIRHGLSKA